MTDMEIGKYVLIGFALLVVFVLLRGIKMILRLVLFVLVIAAVFVLWSRFQAI